MATAAFLMTGQGVAAKPSVMSISLCPSQYVLALADREQIISLPASATSPRLSFLHDRTEGIPVNRRSAEEVIAARPDVVFAGFVNRETTELIRQLGVKVIRFRSAYNIGDVKEQIRTAADALDQTAKGEALVDRIEQAEAAAQIALPDTRQSALVYRGNGYTFAGDTLVSSIMDAAGLNNLAEELGYRRGTYVPLETVILSRPDILIDDWTQSVKTRIAEDFLDHPALRRGWPKRTRIDFPIVYWLCGGESVPVGIERLSTARDEVSQMQDVQQ